MPEVRFVINNYMSFKNMNGLNMYSNKSENFDLVVLGSL